MRHGETGLLRRAGRFSRRRRRRSQEGISPSGDEVSSRSESRRYGGAEEKFKEAKEAYDILSDQQKRAAYDQFGHAGVDTSGAGFSGGAGFRDIFDEVFGDIFGGGGGGQRVYRGADLRYELELGLEEAVAGTTSRIRFPSESTCESCSGTGATPGTSPSTCTTCAGQGQVRVQQGFFSIQQTCPRCHGAGSVVTDPCGDCRGRGKVRHEKTLSVKIPPGVDTGDRIRVGGEGRARRAGRTARRSLRRGPGARPSHLRARRDEPVLRSADRIHHGSPGRRHRRPDARRAGQPEGAGRDADREACSGCAPRAYGRHAAPGPAISSAR